MSADRARRQIKTPKRFEDANEVYWFPERLREAPPPLTKRFVYHLLKRKDVAEDLIGKEVHLFWPEDGQWYRAEVEEVNTRNLKIYVHYPDGDEYESIRAGELVRDGHIAFLEERQHGVPLKRGDIPVDEQDRATAMYLAGEDSGDDEPYQDDEYRMSSDHDSHNSADAEFEATDSDEERRLRSERVRDGRELTRSNGSSADKEVRRSRRDVADAKKGHVQVNRKRALEAAAAAAKRARTESGQLSELQQAEQFKSAVMGLLAPRLAKDANAAAVAAPGDVPAKPVQKPQSKAAQEAAQVSDTRKRAAEQIVNALQLAFTEIKKKGKVAENKIGNPQELGPIIEAALYKANSGLSKEYKSKFRTLVWNMKDPNNPDLRARVLLGELLPDSLVALSSAELASRELHELREKKAEEFAKAKFLDSETAAKYSTAAAAELKEKRHQALQQVSGKLNSIPEHYTSTRPDEAPRQGEEDDEGAKTGALPLTTSGSVGGGGVAGTTSEGALGNGDAGVVGLDGQLVPSALIETGSTFLLEPSTSGLFNNEGMRLARHSSAEGSGMLLPRSSNEGFTTAADRNTAKVVSLKPATPSTAPPHANHREHDDYNPDDFIVGDDDPSSSQMPKRERERSLSGSGANGSSSPPLQQQQQQHRAFKLLPHRAAHHHHHYQQQQPHEDEQTQQHHQEMFREVVEDDADLPDLAPVVPPAAPGTAAANTPPGTPVWHGRLAAPECGVVHVTCSYVAGPQELIRLLPLPAPHLPQDIEVKGTLRQAKVEEFLEELQARSRSRCASLGMLRAFSPASNAMEVDDTLSSEAHQAEESFNRLFTCYATRQRAGVCHLEHNLDTYLLPRGRLARRLLKTARLVALPSAVHLLPSDVPPGHLLMAIIHRREWQPPGDAPPMLAAIEAPGGGLQPAGAVDPRAAHPPPSPVNALAHMASVPLHPTMSAEPAEDTHVLPPPPPLPLLHAESTDADVTMQPAENVTTAQGPPMQGPPEPAALQSLLARLAPVLHSGNTTASPGPQQQHASPARPPPPPPAPSEMPAQYQLHPSDGAVEAPPPTSQSTTHEPTPPALDVNALSALASALQGHLGGSSTAATAPSSAQQQFLLPAPPGAPPSSMMMPPPPASGAPPPAPVLVMQPDGTYKLVNGVEGVEGMPSVLVVPAGEPHPGLTPPHGTPPHPHGGATPQPPAHAPWLPPPQHYPPPGPPPTHLPPPPGPPHPHWQPPPAPMIRHTPLSGHLQPPRQGYQPEGPPPPRPLPYPGRGMPPPPGRGGSYPSSHRGGTAGGRGAPRGAARPYSGWDR